MYKWKPRLILTASLLITFIAIMYVKSEIDKEDEVVFRFECENIANNIKTRLNTHALLLRSGASFFAASENVSRDDWKKFVENYNFDLHLPGILGLGFGLKIPKDKLNEHIQKIRNEGYPEYVVWPEIEREIYTPVVFLEPFSGRNLRAFGYDMMSEPLRKEAMKHACDMDVASLSGKVLLVTENGTDVQAGNLMYVPVYEKGALVNTVEQRRAALKGWVYSPQRMDDFISGILQRRELENDFDKYNLHIYDGLTSSPESLLFESHYYKKRNPDEKNRFTLNFPIDFNGHQWTLVFTQRKGNVFIDYLSVWSVFVGGFIISILLFLLTRSLINTKYNAQKIAKKLTGKLKESESLLQQSQEIANLGTYSFDIKTGLWKSTKLFDTIFGIDANYKRSAEGWIRLIHPDYKELVIIDFKSNHANKQAQTFDKEFKIIRENDKEERWVHWFGRFDFDSNNTPKTLIGTIVDITEQKQVDERLRLSEERYSLAVDGSNDGIWDWNIITNELYFSPRGKSMLGLAEEELFDRFSTWENSLHPEDRDRVLSIIQAYLTNEIPVFEVEYRMRHMDGNYIWVHDRGKTKRDEKGKPYRLAGSKTDITARKQYEEENQRLSKQNQMILDSIEEGIYGLDMEGRISFVNPAAAVLFGSTVEELIGKQAHENHHHTRSDGTIYPIEECPIYSSFHLGVIGNSDNEVFWHKDGTSFPVEYTSAPIKNESGILTGSVVVFKDITQRKLIEKELKESVNRLRTIIEVSPVPIVLTKKIDGEITMINESFVKFANIPSDEIIGRKTLDLYPNKGDRDSLLKAVLKDGFVENFELELKNAYEELFWCSMSLKLITLDNEQILFTAFHDITERKKAEEEIMKHREHLEEMVAERTRKLSISEQKLQKSVKDLSDYKLAMDESSSVIIYDRKGIISYANDKSCKASKFSRDELIGNTHRIFDASFYPESFFENMWRTISQGKVWRGEIKNKAKDGSYYWDDATVIPFLDQNGKPYQYVGVSFDITNRKSIEEDLIKARKTADSANRAKSEFLANMSHEIRTPMNAVIGFTELLSKSVQDKKQRSQVESIRSSGKNLLIIINDILDLSKIEAGKIDIKPVPVNLRYLLSEIENIFAKKVKEKGIILSIDYDKICPKTLLLDEVRLRQILFNLIGNAVKFTDKGHVYVSFENDKNSETEENVDLTMLVKDTGIGIPVDQQYHIFKPFNQMTGQSQVKYGGTGLGLSITKKLIEKMGGNISLESEIGIGSTFSINLPNIPVLDTNIELQQKAFDTSTVLFKPATVLIVDDDEENRKLIIDLLENSPLTIIQAINGEKAIEMAKKYLPDLILMDLHMPFMDGYEATKILKKDKQFTKSIPIMAVTASITSSKEMDNIEKTFDEYLLKPLNIEQFFHKLKKYLKYEFAKTNFRQSTYVTGKPVYSLSEETKEKIPALIETLELEFMPEYEKAVKNQVINEIEKFGVNLLDISEKINCEILIDYSNEIKTYAESFDFQKLIQTLRKFPELLLWLKDEIKKI